MRCVYASAENQTCASKNRLCSLLVSTEFMSKDSKRILQRSVAFVGCKVAKGWSECFFVFAHFASVAERNSGAIIPVVFPVTFRYSCIIVFLFTLRYSWRFRYG